MLPISSKTFLGFISWLVELWPNWPYPPAPKVNTPPSWKTTTTYEEAQSKKTVQTWVDKHSDPFYVEHFKDVLLVWGISYSMELILSFLLYYWVLASQLRFPLSAELSHHLSLLCWNRISHRCQGWLVLNLILVQEGSCFSISQSYDHRLEPPGRFSQIFKVISDVYITIK